jgi:FlaA1/EpsC-like NDP-sugar epimerase
MNSVSDFVGVMIGHFMAFTYLSYLMNIELSLSLKISGMAIFLVSYFCVAFLQNGLKKLDYHLTFGDAIVIVSALLVASLAEIGYLMIRNAYAQITSLLLVFCFSLLTVSILRLVRKKMYDNIQAKEVKPAKKMRLLVIGAGVAAEQLVREMQQSKNKKKYHLVGLVDDNPDFVGGNLQGITILGTVRDIPTLVEHHAVDRVVLAISYLSNAEYQRIMNVVGNRVPLVSIPSTDELASGKVAITKLKSVPISELLPREEVQLDTAKTADLLADKTILVTGAGGSIGSEICRNLLTFKPKRLLLLGHGENSIYLIHQELTTMNNDNTEIVPLIADVQDKKRLLEIMMQHHPDIVYHAAAHKHVPMMEGNPKEAVKNNVFGTRNVAEVAKLAGVDRFVMVSTDKAVNPTNIMGATKRVAEMLVTNLNEAGKTKFCAVRFGNVLGSRGSVVPLFTKQIKDGGPVTVTDFRMTRYFMTIPEASRLVIHAGTMAQGGEIFILDMGQPVKIRDLAARMIDLSGYSPDEISIVETGMRPGEKLYEELLVEKERVTKQVHDKIFLGKMTSMKEVTITKFLNQTLLADNETIKQQLIEFAKESIMEHKERKVSEK